MCVVKATREQAGCPFQSLRNAHHLSLFPAMIGVSIGWFKLKQKLKVFWIDRNEQSFFAGKDCHLFVWVNTGFCLTLWRQMTPCLSASYIINCTGILFLSQGII